MGLMRPSRVSPLVAGLVLLLGAAGCSPRQTPRPRNAAAAPSSSATHNWLYRSGQDYAYEAQPSAGQTVPTTQIYRYLGQHDGVFRLQVDGETATCPDPCEVITLHTGLFHVERVAFDPDSLIGAAFADAFDGQLEVYDPGKRAPDTAPAGSR
jgi:hypothetical protein